MISFIVYAFAIYIYLPSFLSIRRCLLPLSLSPLSCSLHTRPILRLASLDGVFGPPVDVNYTLEFEMLKGMSGKHNRHLYGH